MNTKEAIERVQTRFNKWALDEEDLTALQALGLVTIESEDERIRKHIIEILNNLAPCHWDGNEKAKCIAYLEKQKLISDSLKAAGIDVRQDGGIERHTIPYLEGQKESVTTEWPNLSNCLKNCKKCMAKCFYRKEAYEEKKPTNLWGKEDEEMIQDIIDLLDPNIAASDFHEIEKWLKSLPERFNLPR